MNHKRVSPTGHRRAQPSAARPSALSALFHPVPDVAIMEIELVRTSNGVTGGIGLLCGQECATATCPDEWIEGAIALLTEYRVAIAEGDPGAA